MRNFYEIVKAVRADGNYRRIAEETGLHWNTVRNVISGRQVNPRLDTLEKLDKWCDRQGGNQ